MNRKIIFLIFALMSLQFSLMGQAEVKETEETPIWTTGGDVGMDLSQLMLINPKIGGGENKMAFGGMVSLFAKYKEGKISWDSDGSLQLAVQKLGVKENPFTKNLDLLRLNSKAAYAFNEKWLGGVLFGFESLLLNTYDDLATSSSGSNKLQAKLFSPATLMISPGIDYKHCEHFSVFLSPVAYKAIIVANDEIAGLGVHGNPWTSAGDFENIKHEVGANLKAKYKNVFLKKLTFGSELNLFYNYLGEEHGAEFVDVVWINDIGVELFTGLSLNLLLDTRWDRDIASVLEAGVAPDGLREFRKWMITEALVLKYNYVFK